MRRKLPARQRAAGLGAGVLGACLAFVGLAAPASATQASGGNTASANYSITVGGSPAALLVALGQARVTSVTTREASLEEIFLSYYDEPAS